MTLPRRTRVSRFGWLGAGVATGAAITGGMVVGAMALLGGGEPAAASGAPRFVEQAAAAGLDHVYDGESNFFVGGGVAVFDCDDDGKQDLYLAGGSNPASLYRNQSRAGGELRFARAGGAATDLTQVTGAYPLDIDGDGNLDLAVLRLGENVMLAGTGDCQFRPVNEELGVEGGDAWTVAFSATWEKPDGLPTLAYGNYLELDEAGFQTGTCADHRLMRPNRPDTYGPALALSPGWCTLSILFSDWSRTGTADLRMTNDRHYYRNGQEQLWEIYPDQEPRLFTADDGWQTMQIWGMGIASHDLTGDGRPEVFLTSQGDNKLQTLAPESTGPEYTDIAFNRGVTAHRPFTDDAVLPSTAWHAEFQDVNNDTFVDLFVSKGNVDAMPDFASQDPDNLLLAQANGTFVEAAPEAGTVNMESSRGAALADFNLDGMLDLIVVNRRQPAKLWRNLGPAGNWLAVRLEQPGANRDAVGAWVQVRVGDSVVERELTVGGGHAGGQSGWTHFGLGEATMADTRVQWPDGEWGPWHPVTANQFLDINREAAAARRWVPPDN